LRTVGHATARYTEIQIRDDEDAVARDVNTQLGRR
jgi:hypothetical protein